MIQHQTSKYLRRQAIINPFQPHSQEEKYAINQALNDVFYQVCETFTDQIGILCKYLRNNGLLVSYERIGKMFNKSRFVVFNHHTNYLRGYRYDGRPTILSNEEIEILQNKIKELHSSFPPKYPTYAEILDMINEMFNKTIRIDTLRKMVNSNWNHIFKTCTGKAMDSDRVEVSINDIESNLMELRQAIQNVPINFCFNIDEMGHSEFADAVIKTVIVPINYEHEEAQIPVDRSGKHASCIACISPKGLFCPPQYTIQRKTIDDNIYNYISKESLQIVETDSGYINSQSFLSWINNKFLPELHFLRRRFNYFGRAVIITDGLSAHYNAFSQINLQQENLYIHFLTAHSSDQTQPLDLGIFGGMKRFMPNFKNRCDLSPAGNQILKIHQSLEQMCTEQNCRAAFKAAGLIVLIKPSNQILKEIMGFNVHECKKVRGYNISYILNLVEKQIELTSNQLLVYERYLNPPRIPQKKKRSHIVSFAKNK